ncbi:MAG TPA: DUF6285 domain-containing protein [Pseudomonadales bacterium]|nr:DUF6285 domain-containing protein [Pseudomonadales bacterium]
MPLDRPTAIELLDAINEFILQPPGPTFSFHAKVTSNLLQLLKREWLHGAAANAEEKLGLEVLLGQQAELDELYKTLCEKIRSGELDWQNAALMQHLRNSVNAKLRIDNPKYLGAG